MADGFGVYHEMDYGDRKLERGEYVELEVGAMKNDNALLNIGYIKPHDGQNLVPCLRCGKKFVDDMFKNNHEKTCPMDEVEIPPSDSGSDNGSQESDSGDSTESTTMSTREEAPEPETSIGERVLAQTKGD